MQTHPDPGENWIAPDAAIASLTDAELAAAIVAIRAQYQSALARLVDLEEEMDRRAHQRATIPPPAPGEVGAG